MWRLRYQLRVSNAIGWHAGSLVVAEAHDWPDRCERIRATLNNDNTYEQDAP